MARSLVVWAVDENMSYCFYSKKGEGSIPDGDTLFTFYLPLFYILSTCFAFLFAKKHHENVFLID